MTTAFGPQGPNFSKVRPTPVTDSSAGQDTWFVDCSGPGVYDGTLIYAEFFNVLIANLREAVRGSGVALSNTNDEMLYEAIQAIAEATAQNSIVSGAGVRVEEGVVDLKHGIDGALPTLVYNTISPATDTVVLWDDSTSLHKETTAFNLVRSVLKNAKGVTFDSGNGEVTFTASRSTASASAPLAPNVGDFWWDTDTDTLYERVFDGVTALWMDIT